MLRDCKEQESEKRMWGYHSIYVFHRWRRKTLSTALISDASGSLYRVALDAMFECDKTGFLSPMSKGKKWAVGSSIQYYRMILAKMIIFVFALFSVLPKYSLQGDLGQYCSRKQSSSALVFGQLGERLLGEECSADTDQ